MLGLRRLSLHLVLCLLAVLVAPAWADASFKASCVVTGTAKVHEKLVPGGGGVRYIGGSGAFTFDTIAIACLGTEKGAPLVVSLVVRSVGKYESIVCGTGTAWSPPDGTKLISVQNIVGTKPREYYEQLLVGLKYKIQFVLFFGTFHVNNAPGSLPLQKDLPKTDLSFFLRNNEKTTGPPNGLRYGGMVKLVFVLPFIGPKPYTPSSEYCTKAFSVSGFLHFNS
jgi:hypothetical protein